MTVANTTREAVMAAINILPPITVALARVATEVGAVSKSDRNLQQGFAFRGIDAVLNACGPVLHKHGVIVIPEVVAAQWESVEVGVKRTPMRSCVLTIRFRFVGPAGDHVDAVVIGEAMDSGDKAASKAQSVAMRVALLQVLSLPTNDPDPDPSNYERASAPEHSNPPKATSRGRGQTPIMSVITAAREAGFEGDALATSVAARHGGKALADLSESAMRNEWKHWRGKLLAADAEPAGRGDGGTAEGGTP